MARNKNTINNNEFTVLLTCPPPTTPLTVLPTCKEMDAEELNIRGYTILRKNLEIK